MKYSFCLSLLLCISLGEPSSLYAMKEEDQEIVNSYKKRREMEQRVENNPPLFAQQKSLPKN